MVSVVSIVPIIPLAHFLVPGVVVHVAGVVVALLLVVAATIRRIILPVFYL